MSFTSLTFASFLLTVLVLYWLVRRKDWQNLILLAASYLFYSWATPWYGILLGLSTTADFFIALGLSRFPQRSRLLLGSSLCLNLAVLAFFKYYNFFAPAWLHNSPGLACLRTPSCSISSCPRVSPFTPSRS